MKETKNALLLDYEIFQSKDGRLSFLMAKISNL